MTTKRFRSALILSLLLVGLVSNSWAQETPPLRGRLSLPGKNWGVGLELPGFKLKTVETKPDGRRYMFAENESTGMGVSLTLESIAPGATAASCRDSLQQKTKNPAFKIKDVSFSRSGELDIMQYTIPEFAGQKVNQKNVFGCQLYDNTYVDLHISKVKYVPADDSLFAGVVNSMNVGDIHRSSLELVEQGSRLYVHQDYKGAIGPYSQALELEKTSPQLGKPLWYVLVDNLGMSYGITGDLQKAKETFDYGVSKDPTYPLFYYNLACTFAEKKDAAKAAEYLKKAFDYKANTLPGEAMPDPRTDDSFKDLMKNRDFRQLAETLAKIQ